MDANGVDRNAVTGAEARLAGRVRRTPVVKVERGVFGTPVTLKLELLQHTGSFKPRGAFNRVLAGTVPEAGLIAASGGNAGLAVAHVAGELGHRAEIFVPESSPAIKIARLRRLGATVHVTGAFYADALAASTRRAERTGALVVHAYDQPEVVAGNGTVGLEVGRQVPGLDTVLVAVGGGGLVAGVAAAVGGRVRVVAVEPERIPTLHSALAAGGPVDVPVGGVAADSLGARRIGAVCMAVAARVGMTSVLVPDDAILRARRVLWEELRVPAEPGGATALAALLCGAYRPGRGERVAAVVCGGNTDPATLSSPRPAVPG
ncbi:MAG TPA: threonine/serine dehydratase [Mycobacteriales bacterium]|nr:threonine/serine dehydratase [Mycobacteriales bacterium]